MYLRDPNLIPPPKHVLLYSHLFSLSPFFDFFPTSLISLRARRNQGISTLPRENARSLLSHPPLVVFAGQSQQAGRQAETDQTGPVQAGRQVSPIFPPPPKERAAELQRRRSTGRSIGLA